MTIRTTAADPVEQKYYDFLCDLRDSATINMWGAASYLVRKFSLSQKQASEIFVRWMKSFDEVTA